MILIFEYNYVFMISVRQTLTKVLSLNYFKFIHNIYCRGSRSNILLIYSNYNVLFSNYIINFKFVSQQSVSCEFLCDINFKVF